MPNDHDHEHEHHAPLSYVNTASKAWGCGGELVNACLGFHAVWVSAINFSRAVLTVAYARYPVRNEANLGEIQEYIMSTATVGALLIGLTIGKEDLSVLDQIKSYDTKGFADVAPALVDYIVSQAFDLREVGTTDLTVTPGDDPLEAAKEDVRRLFESASVISHVSPMAQAVVFGSGRPKTPRNKHDIN